MLLTVKKVLRALTTSPLSFFRAVWTVASMSQSRSKSRQLIVLNRLPIHESFTQPLIDALPDDLSLHVVCGYTTETTKSDLSVFQLEPKYEWLLGFLVRRVIVTPASSVSKSLRGRSNIVAHLTHSLVSLHGVYPDSAFDAFDILFLAGEHQLNEFEKIGAIRGLERTKAHVTGYPKLDSKFRSEESSAQLGVREVLLAPSWGAQNILRTSGVEIVKRLREADFKVVVRPHPHSYDYDVEVIRQLEVMSAPDPGLTVESPDFESEAMKSCDVLVSDWSGVAFEFCFTRLRPVVFIDSPRKIQSVESATINLPYMEEELRTVVGLVSSPSNLTETVLEVCGDVEEFSVQIEAESHRYVLNQGNAAAIVKDHLLDLLGS